MAAQALDTDQAKTISVVVVVALLLVGIVVSSIITAIIGRVVVIVVIAVIAAFVWTQRSSISSAAKNCDASFFGIHLTPSNPTVRQHCQDISR